MSSSTSNKLAIIRGERKEYKDAYTAQDHIRFLDTELHAQTENFSKLINRKAVDLLEDELLIPAMYLKVDGGQLIVKVSKTRAVPRKGEYLTAVLLEGDMASHRNWNEKSWRDIRVNHQVAISEAICIWQMASDDPKYNLVGFRGISIEFASRLIDRCVLIFGPKEPPRAYLMNLRQLAEAGSQESVFLNFEYQKNEWQPFIIDSSKDFSKYVLSQLELSPYIVIQGPPGTGKTYKIAELISVLLEQGKRVLVTALTNRALIELAKKPQLADAIEKGQVTKTNLTIDEAKEIPGLQNPRKNEVSGELTLSTFYICSNDAVKASSLYYDYVIMDEASQSLLGMFEATIRLGKKVIWIGDQSQLPAIVEADEKDINHQKCGPLISGMKTICEAFTFPSFMLNHTFRLSNRGARFTSSFYSKELLSARHRPEKYYYPNLPNELTPLFHPEGGPSWLKVSMPTGEKTPIEPIEIVTKIVTMLHTTDKTLHISVLSKLKKTVTQLQISITTQIGNTEMVLVDTVERVQGMDCDICIFFIPNTNLAMSLNQSFFNVATSRASRHTIIVADGNILKSSSCKGGVKLYLEALNENTNIALGT